MPDPKPAYVQRIDPKDPNYVTARKVSDPEEQARLWAEGEKFITPEKAQSLVKLEGTEKPGAIESGLMMAAQGATGNLFFPAVGALGQAVMGDEWAERDRLNNEMYANSTAGRIGHAAGMLLPALLTGGGSAAEQGAARALAGGLTNAAGSMAERLAARVLPEATGLLGGAAQKALTMGARGSAEGALLGIGQAATDAYNHGDPFTVQAALAGGKDGALMGGLAGGGLGAAGGLLGAARGPAGGILEGLAGRLQPGAEEAAQKVFYRMGATEAQVAKLSAEEGGAVGALKRLEPMMREGNLAPREVNAVARKAMEEHQAVRMDVARELEKQGADLTGIPDRFVTRLQDEVMDKYAGTVRGPAVKAMLNKAVGDISNVRGTWTKIVESRDQLQADIQSFLDKVPDMNDGRIFRQEVKSKILNAFDATVGEAMFDASPELAAKYGAATTSRSMARELEKMTANKVSAAMRGTAGELTENIYTRDVITGAAVAAYNPLHAATYLASKGLAGGVERALEPTLTKWAMNSALGSSTQASALAVKSQIQESVANFFKNVPGAASAMKKPPKFTADDTEKAMDKIRYLTSPEHRQAVEAWTKEMRSAGMPQFATAAMSTYNAASKAASKAMPASMRSKAMQNMTKPVKLMAPTMETIKAMQTIKGIVSPLSVLDGMNSGNLSPLTVEAAKEVYPEFMSAVINEAQQHIVSMQAKGEALPMNKVAMLSLVTGVPMNSFMTPEYIQEIQSSFVVEEKAQPPQPATPNPIATSMQTPLEKTLA